MTENEKKVFDDYDVLCDDCTHYWNDLCDGVKIGSTKTCNTFKAVRRVDYQKKIKELERKVDILDGFAGALLVLMLLLFMIAEWC